LLHTTFVTPFDREDIHNLISRMDDVLDLIQDTAESFQLYDIHHLTRETRDLAATQRMSAVRSGVAGNIVIAWAITMPATALMATAVSWATTLLLRS
jgi:hypothetical protein